MKKLSAFLLALGLVLAMTASAMAAEVGVVEYKKRAFSFGPGSLHYPTDLFPELKNVMPGDQLTQQVKLIHRGGSNVNLRFYIQAQGSDQNADFIEKLQLEVEHKNKHLLYDAPDYDATEVSDWVKLATLNPGGTATLDLTLTVPKELDNDDAENLGTVIWKFKVEEIPVDQANAKTGDAILPWVAVLVGSTAALAFLGYRKKRH